MIGILSGVSFLSGSKKLRLALEPHFSVGSVFSYLLLYLSQTEVFSERRNLEKKFFSLLVFGERKRFVVRKVFGIRWRILRTKTLSRFFSNRELLRS